MEKPDVYGKNKFIAECVFEDIKTEWVVLDKDLNVVFSPFNESSIFKTSNIQKLACELFLNENENSPLGLKIETIKRYPNYHNDLNVLFDAIDRFIKYQEVLDGYEELLESCKKTVNSSKQIYDIFYDYLKSNNKK